MGTPVPSLADMFEAGTSIEKEIVEELLSDANLDRKTELAKPFRWSALGVLEAFFSSKGLDHCSETLRQFTETSFRYLVSKNRQGRKEYVEALRAVVGSVGMSPTGLVGERGVRK